MFAGTLCTSSPPERRSSAAASSFSGPPRRHREPVSVLAEGAGDRQPDPARTTRDQGRLLRQRFLLPEGMLRRPQASLTAGGHPIGGPTTMPPVSTEDPRRHRRSPLAVALVAGCGGSDNGTGSRSKPGARRPPTSPRPQGQTLRRSSSASQGGQGPVVSPAAALLPPRARTASPSASSPPAATRSPTPQVAIYAAPARDVDGQAIGPFPARIEDLTTKPAFQAKTTADDPAAAQVAYVSRHPARQARPLGVRRPDQERQLLPVQPAADPNPVGDYPMPAGRPAGAGRPHPDRGRRSRTSPRSTPGSRPTTCTATTSPTCSARSRWSCSSRPPPSARAASAAPSPTSPSR